MEFNHVTVLRKESVEYLDIKPDGVYVDGTLGGGGHSELILEHLGSNGRLIGIDKDESAHIAAAKRLERFGDKFIAVRGNFADIKQILSELSIEKIDGMIIDLGVSSYQLDQAERGFSYMNDGKLDMRMDRRQTLDAKYIVNNYSESELTRIIKEYGEERWANRIAKFIVEERKVNEINTTFELVEIIKKAIPLKARKDGPHPAKRTFQAIRIEVNDELNIIKNTISDAISVMNVSGVMSIITFHSLEDRIVKQTYKELSKGCICPQELPVCMCNNKPKVKIITTKPTLPSADEIEQNPRSRSAKLRVARKL